MSGRHFDVHQVAFAESRQTCVCLIPSKKYVFFTCFYILCSTAGAPKKYFTMFLASFYFKMSHPYYVWTSFRFHPFMIPP